MIVLFTDFSIRDPYVGQIKARLLELAPAQQLVDLLHEAPAYNAHASAHLLAAFFYPRIMLEWSKGGLFAGSSSRCAWYAPFYGLGAMSIRLVACRRLNPKQR